MAILLPSAKLVTKPETRRAAERGTMLWGAARSCSPVASQLMLYLTSPTRASGRLALSEAILILCPQRDSNPRCRLESAKLGISRRLPRSFAIDRNLLPLGQTARSGVVGSLQRFPPFCGGVRPPRSLDLGLMCDHTVSRLATTPGSHTGLWTISRLRPRAYLHWRRLRSREPDRPRGVRRPRGGGVGRSGGRLKS